MTQREFRKKHAPEGPPMIGVNIREGDAYCLTQGIVPDSIRQMAADGLRVFWPTGPNLMKVVAWCLGPVEFL